MTRRPRMRAALVHAEGDGADADAAAAARGKLQCLSKLQQQQSSKRFVAGVGLVTSIVVAVVTLVLAVLASDPLGATRAALNGTAGGGVKEQLPRETSERAAIAAFIEWFEAAGGVRHEHVGIAEFPNMGKGVIASEPVSEHEQLLFVPMSIVICRETITKTIPQSLKSKFAQLTAQEDELLTAFLLLEMLNERSYWRPYLEILPKHSPDGAVASSPLLYASESYVDALQDERMVAAARRERKVIKKAFKKFTRLFKSVFSVSSRHQADLSSPLSGGITLEQYSHARFLINSRAFTIRGQRYLVPFGDVFNGKAHGSTRKFDNGQRFLQYHALKDSGVVIRADRAVAADSQVFEDYGDNSNYIYFLHHGFIMPANHFDCAALRLPMLTEETTTEADVLEQKLKVLSHYRVENGPVSCVLRDGRVSQESLELTQFYFALFHMGADAMRGACRLQANYARCFLSPTAASLFATEEDRGGDEELASFMARAIEHHLKSYATSLDDDLKLLLNENDGGLQQPPPPRSAVEFRASRKQLLHEALAKLQKVTTEKREVEVALDYDANVIRDAEVNAEARDEPSLDAATRIDRFERWIESQKPPVNHLELRFVSDTMGFGTFATKPLQQGEIYLSVPVSMVMNLQSASASKSLRRLMQHLARVHHRAVVDDTLLLVLHLLDEKFGPDHLNSRWKPYLDVLPSVEAIERSSPLFYDEDVHMELLKHSDLYTHAVSYRGRVAQAYRDFVENSGGEAIEWITEQRFRYANAILDSRTIWWSGQRHLVPLLDMVNCLDLGFGHAAHHTDLDEGAEHEPVAVTKASWDFVQGEQVVENYAQPNYIYLLFHGFVLASGRNQHDCAHFSLATNDRETIDTLAQPRKRVLMEMIEALNLKTWTPELCIDPASDQSVSRFAKIAFIMATPLQALEATEQKRHGATATKLTSHQVQAGLALVGTKLQALEDGLRAGDRVAAADEDNRSRVIITYLEQQRELMTSLQAALQQGQKS